MRGIVVGAVVLVGCATTAAVTQAPPAPPRHTNLPLSLTQMSLSNGLRVVLVHDDRAPEVEVTMRYRVGFVDDPAGQEGMAHLVEHLMFQQVVGAQTIFSRVVNDATAFNGVTSLDATTYTERAPRERLDEMLAIEAVRLGLRCTSISESVFERERQVVINEVRWRDAADQLRAAIDAGLYPAGHPYHRPPESELSVGSITRAQACAFADAHYAPGNAALVISGNLETREVEAALSKALVPVPKRETAPPVAVPAIALAGRKLEAPGPVDDDALIVAWPLPADPMLRVRVRAIADVMGVLIDGRVRGRVRERELGDDRAPMIGFVVTPSTDETFDQARRGVERAIDDTPRVFASTGIERFDRFVWDLTTQTEIAQLFRSFEDGGGRDEHVAEYVLSGLDPGGSLAAEMKALSELTRDQARAIARDQLGLARATVLTLRQTPGKKRGVVLELGPPIHDQGQRHESEDPAAAHQPLGDAIGGNAFAGARTRTLANGMHVVLLPLTSVPTVDVRLVIHAGSADEPAGKRGAALVAAHALSPSVRDLQDEILFLASGSTLITDVRPDHTAFTAHGLDMHVDLLLTGLARLVIDGTYAHAHGTAAALRQYGRKMFDDSGSLTDAWRRAMYGPQHPYVEAGLVRHVSDTLALADAIQFHDAHYAPDNATLVIAGRFDADLADRWIDYLFADWKGTSQLRESPRAHPEAASLARADDTASVLVTITLPAIAGTPATRQIAAAMLDDIATDVRHQLGASYVIDASLDESRLATSYDIAGAIDATRAREAIELIRGRLATLNASDAATAQAFVAARHRVYGHLLSLTGSAAGLAARVEHDIDLGRPPMSDVATAGQVRRTTIDDMAQTLADLDLSHATIVMTGPRAEVEAAFAVLDRKPTFFARDRAPTVSAAQPDDDADREDAAVARDEETRAKSSDRSSFTIMLQPGYSSAGLTIADVSGPSFAVDVGFRQNEHQAVGLHASFGDLSGSHPPANGPADSRVPFSIVPIEVAGFARGTAYDRLWAALFAGVHLDFEQELASSSSDMGFCIGAEAGLELLHLGDHHLGVFVRAETELGGQAGYAGSSLGLTYRR